MTCKDCAYFNLTEHLKPEWIGSNRCKKHTADGYQEYVGEDCEVCEDFVSKDGTYHNGTYHCPRCGRVVSKWGLCMDCEILYGGCKQEVFDEYGNYKYPSDIILDKPNNATSCVKNALDALNSCESVSK